jgi:hypothetical protein
MMTPRTAGSSAMTRTPVSATRLIYRDAEADASDPVRVNSDTASQPRNVRAYRSVLLSY